MRALIVDDDELARTLMDILLKDAGVDDIAQATNGREALALLKYESADLIISDWSMPEMDGLELLKACKGDAALKDIPFIMSGARGQQSEIRQAMEVGVDAYIVKPFSLGELHAVLRGICRRADGRPLRGAVRAGIHDRWFPTTESEVLPAR